MARNYSKRQETPGLPKRGARVVLKGIPGPSMLVSRHTQFDNGEVETVYVLENGQICRVWLPADILVAEHIPFRPRSN